MQNPLSKEDVQAIMDELEPLMIWQDYQRRDGTCYLFNSEIVRIFDFQVGCYRPKAYFNLAFVVRALDDSTRPRIYDCPVYGRLDHLVPEVEEYELATSFGQPGMTRAERLAYIVQTVRSVVLPFHTSLSTIKNLVTFICSPRARGFRVHESVKHFIGI